MTILGPIMFTYEVLKKTKTRSKRLKLQIGFLAFIQARNMRKCSSRRSCGLCSKYLKRGCPM